MVIGPRNVQLQETGQNAIVAWNGEEEVLILSTDMKSSESITVLEFIPLPSNPTSVEETDPEIFDRLIKAVNKKVLEIRSTYALTRGFMQKAGAESGVEITFYEKIGAHEVTVVKVTDLDHFMDWVTDFSEDKGFEDFEISPEFEDTISNYLNKGIDHFVFDVIETGDETKTINPLIYQFKTDYLYYPLEITATSDVGDSLSSINLFLITIGKIDTQIVRGTFLRTGTGFDYYIAFNKFELDEISPEIGDLFVFKQAFVMNAQYDGYLDILKNDLVVYQEDIYVPTLFDILSRYDIESIIIVSILIGIIVVLIYLIIRFIRRRRIKHI